MKIRRQVLTTVGLVTWYPVYILLLAFCARSPPPGSLPHTVQRWARYMWTERHLELFFATPTRFLAFDRLAGPGIAGTYFPSVSFVALTGSTVPTPNVRGLSCVKSCCWSKNGEIVSPRFVPVVCHEGSSPPSPLPNAPTF